MLAVATTTTPSSNSASNSRPSSMASAILVTWNSSKQSSWVWDAIAAAKALKTFGDANKPVEVKAAYIDGQIVDAKGVAQLAALPPKIELLSRLVGSLKSPISGLVYVLSGNQSGLVRVLNQVREQKEAAGTAA